MKLTARARFGFGGAPFLVRVEQREEGGFSGQNISTQESPAVRFRLDDASTAPSGADVWLPTELGYLSEGDIVRLNPQAGEVRVLYRRASRHNTLFFTERCNSRCLMCSQPPRDVEDGYLVEEILQMIPWMAKDTPELGITGGEPSLLHGKLIELIAAAKTHLPATALHLLSNGRLFAYMKYARQVAEVAPPDFMVGVPLYADVAEHHDFVVQAAGAFEQTIFGLLNLARVGVRIELRMVIHRETYTRLPGFARFVARNLPFVDQVVLMGLEPTGYARSNLRALWIDPADYQEELERCVGLLDDAGLAVAIYNHPLCVLRPSLLSFARQAISDWKNIYLPECEPCARKTDCGGFFESAAVRHSDHIRPLGR